MNQREWLELLDCTDTMPSVMLTIDPREYDDEQIVTALMIATVCGPLHLTATPETA